MSHKRWIGGFLGWVASQSILGAIAGYVIGSILDMVNEFNGKSVDADETSDWDGDDSRLRQQEGARNSFLFSLMVLASHIIQADGKIMHSEMELVRRLLRQNFGEAAVEQGNEMLLRLFEYRKQKGETAWNAQISEACREMAAHMTQEQRLQLIAFLCEIAKADGCADSNEVQALYTIAVNLSLSADVIDQLLHLGGSNLDDDYAALGITRDATDDEVRKAYKKMALQYHPDRVATLGEDVRAAAEKKFQEINNAKERIFKARKIKN